MQIDAWRLYGLYQEYARKGNVGSWAVTLIEGLNFREALFALT